MSSILVIYYSRGGHTQKVAEAIAQTLNADLKEIREKKSRRGLLGWLSAGKEAWQKKLAEIEDPIPDLSSYSHIIIGTPVWIFTMASPIRSWLTQHQNELSQKKLIFFATMGGAGDESTFLDMQAMCNNTLPVLKKAFLDKEIKQNDLPKGLEDFIAALKNIISPS